MISKMTEHFSSLLQKLYPACLRSTWHCAMRTEDATQKKTKTRPVSGVTIHFISKLGQLTE